MTAVITLAACGRITTPASTQPQTPIQGSAQALDWPITTVIDVAGTGYSRSDGTAVALDADGNPHIVYDFVTGSYPTTNVMKYASYDSTDGWTPEDVPGEAPTNESISLVLDDTGTPHIAFAHGGSLFYASPDSSGSGWTVATVDTVSQDNIPFTSLAFDGNGNPCISYMGFSYSNWSAVLRYVSYDNSGWTDPVTVYDPVPGTPFRQVGGFPSLAFDSNGVPHISSYDWSESTHVGKLVYSSYDPTASQWSTVTVDGGDATYNNVGHYGSLAFDGGDHPHISYQAVRTSGTSELKSELRYAWNDGSDWQPSVVDDSTELAGRYSSLALDSYGHPHVSYLNHDAATDLDTLMYASYDGSDWQPSEVDDSTEFAGRYSSLALDPTKNLAYIGFVNEDTGNLMLAVGPAGIISPEAAISHLIDSVNGLVDSGMLKTGQAGGLTRPLDNALRSLEKGKSDDAYNQLQDFIAKVQAKTPTPLPTDVANDLIRTAEAVETSLGY